MGQSPISTSAERRGGAGGLGGCAAARPSSGSVADYDTSRTLHWHSDTIRTQVQDEPHPLGGDVGGLGGAA